MEIYGELADNAGGWGTWGGGDMPAYRVETTSAIGAGAGGRWEEEDPRRGSGYRCEREVDENTGEATEGALDPVP